MRAVLSDGSAVVLRRPRERDLRGIGRVFAEAVREGTYFGTDTYRFVGAEERAWLRARSGSRGTVLGAFTPRGRCVGFVAVERGRRRKDRHTACLDPVVVARSHRGRGLGRALILAALEWARSHRIEKLWLGVYASNRRAVGLYRSVGFVPDGVHRRHYIIGGRYVDGLQMALFLRPRGKAGATKR